MRVPHASVAQAVFLFCTHSLVGQTATAVITGVVTSPKGAALRDAPVQAKNASTGTPYRTLSSSTGAYMLNKLTPGTYEVSVYISGFSYDPYIKSGVVVKAGETLRLDIQLPEGSSLETLGDDPARVAAVIRGKAVQNGPTPRTPDGKPDFSGVWEGHDDAYPEQPDLVPWAAALMQERLENNAKDHPSGHCLPSAPFPLGVSWWKIVQTPSLMVTLFEDIQGYRQVFLDGRGHPKSIDPSWLGHSTGKWQGDTLVIDSVGFNNRSWIILSPHTEMLHVVERYRRPDLGHLDIQITLEDAGTFRKPWRIHMVWTLSPNQEIVEYVCENDRDHSHLVGK